MCFRPAPDCAVGLELDGRDVRQAGLVEKFQAMSEAASERAAPLLGWVHNWWSQRGKGRSVGPPDSPPLDEPGGENKTPR